MKLAFSKPTRTDEDRDLLFRSFGPVGYDGLQLKAGQYDGYIDEPARFVDEWGPYAGVASALITAGNLDAQSNEALRRVFRFAGAVGSDLVILCLGIPREGLSQEQIEDFAGQASRLGAEAQDAGVKLSVHNHYGCPAMTRHDLEVFFGAVEAAVVGLTLDTAHLVKSGEEDLAAIVRDFAAVIDNFHLKDFAAGEWRVLGHGDIDFGPVFAAIAETGYDGWVSCDEESGSELVPAMEECYRFMRAGLPGG
jgi:sugar phosphate isomerase/epimerase